MKLLFSVLLSVFALNSAQASTYLDKVVDYINAGELQGLGTKDVSAYHAMTTAPTQYVEAHSQQSSTMANGDTVTVLLKRSPISDTITAVQILLISKVHPAIESQIHALPATYAMHGDVGDAGRASLASSGLREMALEIADRLINKGLANQIAVNSQGAGLVNVYASIERNAAIGIQSTLKEVLIEQYISRTNLDGSFESLNASIKKDANAKLLNFFKIEIAFPAQASDKMVKTVLSEIITAIQ